MAALEALILASCMGMSGNQHDACTNALEAGTKQTGVADNVGKIEDQVSKRADREARYFVGDTGMSVGAVVGGIAKAAVDKSATMKFPMFVPSMYVSTEIGIYKSMLGVEWKF